MCRLRLQNGCAIIWISVRGIIFLTHRESLPHFLHKLQEKKQTKAQQEQASHAISLYYELVHDRGSHTEIPSPKKANPPGKVPEESSPRPDALPNEANLINISHKASSLGKTPPEPSPKTVSPCHKTNTATGVSWKTRYTRLVNEIQVRHYSPKTLKAYTQWGSALSNIYSKPGSGMSLFC